MATCLARLHPFVEIKPNEHCSIINPQTAYLILDMGVKDSAEMAKERGP